MTKPEIVPAVLVHSFRPLQEQLEALAAGSATLVQVDIVGENFLASEEAMPLWEEFDFEFDLMTEDARSDAEVAVTRLGASRIVVHTNSPRSLEAIEFLQPYRVGEFAVAVGVALPCDATPALLKEFKGLYDYVQVMGIARVGFQGQPFDVRALDTVANLRAVYPNLFIQVDGGVKPDNFKKVLDAGANRIVVGSAYQEVVAQRG